MIRDPPLNIEETEKLFHFIYTLGVEVVEKNIRDSAQMEWPIRQHFDQMIIDYGPNDVQRFSKQAMT
jgi:hypothetical protein